MSGAVDSAVSAAVADEPAGKVHPTPPELFSELTSGAVVRLSPSVHLAPPPLALVPPPTSVDEGPPSNAREMPDTPTPTPTVEELPAPAAAPAKELWNEPLPKTRVAVRRWAAG